jgi:NAD(P)-dependent dehydrogenase (short-subunit alcohol dehydrogenase family)
VVLERLSLEGRACIVTGGGRGLGRQMALHMAAAGADVVVAARSLDQIEDTAHEIRKTGRRAIAVAMDVRKSDDHERVVNACVKEYGKLDVMVANAGGGGPGALKPLLECTDDDWYDTIDTNYSNAFFSARAAVRVMRPQGHGVIINTASGTALRGDPRLFVYGSAKAGLIALSKSLAVMLARENIRVNVIVPGFVAQKPPEADDEGGVRRSQGRFIPVGRIGEAWELGPLAVFLASDASSYMTGEIFCIDGGGLAGGVAPVGFVPEVP